MYVPVNYASRNAIDLFIPPLFVNRLDRTGVARHQSLGFEAALVLPLKITTITSVINKS